MPVRASDVHRMSLFVGVVGVATLAGARPPLNPIIQSGASWAMPAAQKTAQPQPDGDGIVEVDESWLEKQVAALDSDDFATRDKASNEIAGNEHLTLKTIEHRLSDPSRPLSPEQKMRLSEAGLKMFTSSQRGAMGVSFSLTDGAVDGVKVGGAVDGFDAKRVLKAGDVIREMDGVSLTFGDQMRSRNMVVALIISHDPGDEVTLNVIRNGEPVVVRMKLGNYRDLRNANELDAPRLRLAWDMRCQRAAAASAEAEPVEAGISAERWDQISDPVKRLAARRVALNRQNNFILPGNALEAAPDDPGVAMVAGGSSRMLLNKPEEDFSSNQRLQMNLARAQQIQQQIQYFNALIQRDQRRLRDPNTPDQTRQMLKNNIASYQQQVNSLRAAKKQMMGMEP
jgi:hypothetical protein